MAETIEKSGYSGSSMPKPILSDDLKNMYAKSVVEGSFYNPMDLNVPIGSDNMAAWGDTVNFRYFSVANGGEMILRQDLYNATNANFVGSSSPYFNKNEGALKYVTNDKNMFLMSRFLAYIMKQNETELFNSGEREAMPTFMIQTHFASDFNVAAEEPITELAVGSLSMIDIYYDGSGLPTFTVDIETGCNVLFPSLSMSLGDIYIERGTILFEKGNTPVWTGSPRSFPISDSTLIYHSFTQKFPVFYVSIVQDEDYPQLQSKVLGRELIKFFDIKKVGDVLKGDLSFNYGLANDRWNDLAWQFQAFFLFKDV